MRQAPDGSTIQVVVGGESLYQYALPFRCDRLLSRLLTPPDGRKIGRRRIVRPDRPIFTADSGPAGVWIVSGTARLVCPSGSLLRPSSRLTIPEELIGLTEALAEIPYAATLTAVTTCECRRVRREDLIAILQKDPDLLEALLRDLAEQVVRAFRAAYEARVTLVTYARGDVDV